ncbi:MAG: hypothetical protein HYW15_03560 [Candidatus Giovannonibacteria bacterium]|nr:MAG: hypothetical protein HYW15_03560 [Candidatus Giovannonibacteria bacterium]
MKKFYVFYCEICGESSKDSKLIKKHEKYCIPLKIGQRVKFIFGLISCEGRITGLKPPLHFGAKATVDLETDVEVTDVDYLHDGKHVWVERDQISEVL